MKKDNIISLVPYKHAMLTKVVAWLVIICFSVTNITYGYDRSDIAHLKSLYGPENDFVKARVRAKIGSNNGKGEGPDSTASLFGTGALWWAWKHNRKLTLAVIGIACAITSFIMHPAFPTVTAVSIFASILIFSFHKEISSFISRINPLALVEVTGPNGVSIKIPTLTLKAWMVQPAKIAGRSDGVLYTEPISLEEAKKMIFLTRDVTYIPTEDKTYLMRNHKYSIPAVIDAIRKSYVKKGAQQFLFDFHEDAGWGVDGLYKRFFNKDYPSEDTNIDEWIEFAEGGSTEASFNIDLVKAGLISPKIVVIKRDTPYEIKEVERKGVTITLEIIGFEDFLKKYAQEFRGKDPEEYFANIDLDFWTEGQSDSEVDFGDMEKFFPRLKKIGFNPGATLVCAPTEESIPYFPHSEVPQALDVLLGQRYPQDSNPEQGTMPQMGEQPKGSEWLGGPSGEDEEERILNKKLHIQRRLMERKEKLISGLWEGGRERKEAYSLLRKWIPHIIDPQVEREIITRLLRLFWETKDEELKRQISKLFIYTGYYRDKYATLKKIGMSIVGTDRTKWQEVLDCLSSVYADENIRDRRMGERPLELTERPIRTRRRNGFNGLVESPIANIIVIALAIIAPFAPIFIKRPELLLGLPILLALSLVIGVALIWRLLLRLQPAGITLLGNNIALFAAGKGQESNKEKIARTKRDRQKAKDSAKRARSAARKGDLEEAARLYIHASNLYYEINKFAKATRCSEKAAAILEGLGAREEALRNWRYAGRMYSKAGNLEKSAFCYEKIAALLDYESDKQALAVVFKTLGDIYHELCIYDKAAEYFEKSAIAYEDLGDKINASKNWALAAMVSLKYENYTRAAYDDRRTAELNLEVGNIEEAQRHYKFAIKNFVQANLIEGASDCLKKLKAITQNKPEDESGPQDAKLSALGSLGASTVLIAAVVMAQYIIGKLIITDSALFLIAYWMTAAAGYISAFNLLLQSTAIIASPFIKHEFGYIDEFKDLPKFSDERFTIDKIKDGKSSVNENLKYYPRFLQRYFYYTHIKTHLDYSSNEIPAYAMQALLPITAFLPYYFVKDKKGPFGRLLKCAIASISIFIPASIIGTGIIGYSILASHNALTIGTLMALLPQTLFSGATLGVIFGIIIGVFVCASGYILKGEYLLLKNIFGIVRRTRRDIGIFPGSQKHRREGGFAFIGGTGKFDIERWLSEVYIPKMKDLSNKCWKKRLTGKEVISFVEEVIHPIKPDFSIEDIIRPETQVEPHQLSEMGGRIHEQILLPKGLIIEVGFGQEYSIGRIIPERTEYVTSLSGRRVPVYTIKTQRGSFGQAWATANYILLPIEIEGKFKEVISFYQQMWTRYKKGELRRPIFKQDPAAIVIWIMIHFIGQKNLEEGLGLIRQADLTEEISHLDTFSFVEALWGYKINRFKPDEWLRIAKTILQPNASLQSWFQKFDEAKTQGLFSEVIIELEGKLNALIHSPYPAYTFLEILGGVIFLEVRGEIQEPPKYQRTRELLLLLLGKKLMNEETYKGEIWLDYLDEALLDLDEFNRTLQDAAMAVYQEEFLTQKERDSMLQHKKNLSHSTIRGAAWAGVGACIAALASAPFAVFGVIPAALTYGLVVTASIMLLRAVIGRMKMDILEMEKGKRAPPEIRSNSIFSDKRASAELEKGKIVFIDKSIFGKIIDLPHEILHKYLGKKEPIIYFTQVIIFTLAASLGAYSLMRLLPAPLPIIIGIILPLIGGLFYYSVLKEYKLITRLFVPTSYTQVVPNVKGGPELVITYDIYSGGVDYKYFQLQGNTKIREDGELKSIGDFTLIIHTDKNIHITHYFPIDMLGSPNWKRYRNLGISQTFLYWLSKFSEELGIERIIIITPFLYNMHVFRKFFADTIEIGDRPYLTSEAEDLGIFDSQISGKLAIFDTEGGEVGAYVELEYIGGSKNRYKVKGTNTEVVIDKGYVYNIDGHILGLISCEFDRNARFLGRPKIPEDIIKTDFDLIIPEEIKEYFKDKSEKTPTDIRPFNSPREASGNVTPFDIVRRACDAKDKEDLNNAILLAKQEIFLNASYVEGLCNVLVERIRTEPKNTEKYFDFVFEFNQQAESDTEKKFLKSFENALKGRGGDKALADFWQFVEAKVREEKLQKKKQALADKIKEWLPSNLKKLKIGFKDETMNTILSAINEVDRKTFVPADYRERSYECEPLPIGYDQTISNPNVVAIMTTLLFLENFEDDFERNLILSEIIAEMKGLTEFKALLGHKKLKKVLEIGTGSGYQAAILSGLAEKVVTIERNRALAQAAAKRLEELKKDNVKVFWGDGSAGYLPQGAEPYDAIIVTCAPERVPKALIDQLAVGGRIVIPVGKQGEEQTLVVGIKHKDKMEWIKAGTVDFVPLVNGKIDPAATEGTAQGGLALPSHAEELARSGDIENLVHHIECLVGLPDETIEEHLRVIKAHLTEENLNELIRRLKERSISLDILERLSGNKPHGAMPSDTMGVATSRATLNFQMHQTPATAITQLYVVSITKKFEGIEIGYSLIQSDGTVGPKKDFVSINLFTDAVELKPGAEIMIYIEDVSKNKIDAAILKIIAEYLSEIITSYREDEGGLPTEGLLARLAAIKKQALSKLKIINGAPKPKANIVELIRGRHYKVTIKDSQYCGLAEKWWKEMEKTFGVAGKVIPNGNGEDGGVITIEYLKERARDENNGYGGNGMEVIGRSSVKVTNIDKLTNERLLTLLNMAFLAANVADDISYIEDIDGMEVAIGDFAALFGPINNYYRLCDKDNKHLLTDTEILDDWAEAIRKTRVIEITLPPIEEEEAMRNIEEMVRMAVEHLKAV